METQGSQLDLASSIASVPRSGIQTQPRPPKAPAASSWLDGHFSMQCLNERNKKPFSLVMFPFFPLESFWNRLILQVRLLTWS